MAIFRKRDREKRREWKAYHAAAIHFAQNTYDFGTEGWEDYQAWRTYLDRMQNFGHDPAPYKKFVRDLKRPS